MRFLLACCGLSLAAAAHAAPVPAPHVGTDDTWTYSDTREDRGGWHQERTEATVDRAGPGGIALDTKPEGAAVAPVERLFGADWSRSRSVNGHQTVVNRPLSFPLNEGKSWLVDYAENHPNRMHTSEHIHETYTVTGWEDVTVPAGRFRALKIEAEGEWQAAIAPGVAGVSGARVDAQGVTSVTQTSRIAPSTVSGRLFKAYWYVPAVKRWVKSVEEYYDPNDVRTQRFTEELQSYKVSD